MIPKFGMVCFVFIDYEMFYARYYFRLLPPSMTIVFFVYFSLDFTCTYVFFHCSAANVDYLYKFVRSFLSIYSYLCTFVLCRYNIHTAHFNPFLVSSFIMVVHLCIYLLSLFIYDCFSSFTGMEQQIYLYSFHGIITIEYSDIMMIVVARVLYCFSSVYIFYPVSVFECIILSAFSSVCTIFPSFNARYVWCFVFHNTFI